MTNTKPIRIVVAEDDPQIAEIQKRFIERIEGFELVGMAHGLTEAEDLVEILKPELLLLDIQFPTGTGLELLRKLRAQGNSIDVILITAAKEVETLREAMHGGVFDYILKPVVFERLQDALNRYQKHAAHLETLASLAQADVDTLMPRNENTPKAASQPQRLPKGIDGLTLDKVRAVVASSNQSLSAEGLGEEIGASRTTARRYLEYLVSTQELEAEVNYGTVGRPERRYKPL